MANYKNVTTEIEFNSPWLEFERSSWPQLREDINCDVAIVGAGISGVAALYFLLTRTNKNVVLIEKNFVASGATGNNAGIAAAFIERPAQELVDEFGFAFTKNLLDEINQSWDLFLDVIDKTDSKNNFAPFPQIALGFTSVKNFLNAVSQEDLNKKIGRNRRYFIADDETIRHQIPNHLQDKVEFIAHAEILKLLNIVDAGFIAAAIPVDDVKIARVNSALLCHQILNYLQQHFPQRFSIYENTNIKNIKLNEQENILHHEHGVIHSRETILCTNGFVDIIITDEKSDISLRDIITPRLGYMIAYREFGNSGANAYFDDRNIYPNTPYFYKSHISSEQGDGLTLVGGPEFNIHKPEVITQESIQQKARQSLAIYKQFLKNALKKTPVNVEYFWYGLMGYTADGLRLVGQHPKHPHLWYNIGCNGVGIVPAFGSAKKIAELINSL